MQWDPCLQAKNDFGMFHEFACHPCAMGHAHLLCIFPILVYVLPKYVSTVFILKGWKIKRRIVFRDTWNLYEIQISVSMYKVLFEHSNLIYLHIIYGCCRATTESTCDRDGTWQLFPFPLLLCAVHIAVTQWSFLVFQCRTHNILLLFFKVAVLTHHLKTINVGLNCELLHGWTMATALCLLCN